MAPTHLLDDSEKHPPKRAKSSNTSTPRTIPLDNTPFTVEYLNKSKDILNREAQELPEFLHSRYLAEIEKKEGERHRQYTITPIEEWREMTEVDSVTSK
jgi:DNA phosphorothioation-dependent restriction protein DptG